MEAVFSMHIFKVNWPPDTIYSFGHGEMVIGPVALRQLSAQKIQSDLKDNREGKSAGAISLSRRGRRRY